MYEYKYKYKYRYKYKFIKVVVNTLMKISFDCQGLDVGNDFFLLNYNIGIDQEVSNIACF